MKPIQITFLALCLFGGTLALKDVANGAARDSKIFSLFSIGNNFGVLLNDAFGKVRLVYTLN